MDTYTEIVERIAINATKYTNKKVRPDIPPGEGETVGSRSEANADEWNREYWMRVNTVRKEMHLPHIPLERFEQCATK